MTSIEQPSNKILGEEPKVQNSSFKDILRKRALPTETNNQADLSTQEKQTKKLKIEALKNKMELRASLMNSEKKLNQEMDNFDADLRLKLGEKNFEGPLSKDKIESYLAFNLGRLCQPLQKFSFRLKIRIESIFLRK